MSQEKESVDIKLVNSVASQNLTDLGASFAEIALDYPWDDSFFKDIPIFGSIVKIYSAGKEIKYQLFVKKVANFLKSLAKASQEDRNKFVKEMNENPKKKIDFGQSILLLLERADNMKKPEIIGKIVSTHIKGFLPYDEAMRLCSMIDRAYLPDLEYLKTFQDGIQSKRAIAESLYNVGLISFGGIDSGIVEEPDSGGVIYSINEYGNALVKYGLSDD